jgi:spermidine/putrescine transport system ATP-binding protein
VVYLGTSTTYSVLTGGGGQVVVYRQNVATAEGEEIVEGQVGWLSWLPEHSYVLGVGAAAEPDERSRVEEGAGQ